ncbi:MAG TPA: AglZ/HisF2 family acetamidino modification protein [Thermoanaerobaculia bacterium]|nr:AglZ/HisF2 family acetamidino modification protein [Thermoanaerobaculia bacterium]
MLIPRVIPCLLLRSRGLVKTTKFRRPVYLGDPVNVIRIFNEKEVDEVILLDITATLEQREPNFSLLEEISSECFMPLAYGGGVRTTSQMRTLYSLGIEKVALNTAAIDNPALISEAASCFGSQSVAVSIDVKKDWKRRYRVVTSCGRRMTTLDPVAFAVSMQQHGAGEVILNNIGRDGTMKGYDLDLVRSVTSCLDIPVIACGGAASVSDLAGVVRKGRASAAGAGSMFVFQGLHRGVLISFPSHAELEKAFAGTEPGWEYSPQGQSAANGKG